MGSFRFPWLLSNVLDARSGQPLGGADRTRIIEWEGVRVGLMGLVEREVRRSCIAQQQSGNATGRMPAGSCCHYFNSRLHPAVQLCQHDPNLYLSCTAVAANHPLDRRE